MAEGPRVQDGVPELTAAEAAATVGDDAVVTVSGFGSVGYPKAVPLALADSDRDLSLTVISGGSVGDEIDTAMVEAGAIARRFPYQATPIAREKVNDGTIALHDRHISSLGDDVVFEQLAAPDVAIVEAVAVGADWLVPSTSIGQTPAFVEQAPELIVEVNEVQPRELERFHDVYRPDAPPNREPIPLTDPGERIGGPRVRLDPDKLRGVVRSDRRDSTYSFRSPTADDRAIAANLREFLEAEMERNALFAEAVRLQFGVGSLGNALMGELAETSFGDRDVAYYGEVIQDGLLDLLEAGVLDVASATTLALSAEGQDRLFGAIADFEDDVVLRPADVSNSPELIGRLGVVAVNSALEVDVYGHVNSTHVNGSRLINGIGGSGDFNRNAAVAAVALPSTASGGDLSRVVPMVPHVDHTEHDVGVVITEQGVADLRGLSPRERATELIEQCAHPDFRADLRAYYERALEDGGHMPHDLSRAYEWTQ
ncbi:MAG: acetyl-CoA hydrolase/transferase C-terminal domain-containing protein [Halorientalis sp.]